MQRYLQQLHSDIEAAIRHRWRQCPPHYYQNGIPDPYLVPPQGLEKETSKEDDAPIEEILEEQETWLHTRPDAAMVEKLGFDLEQFPPSESLTVEQIQELCMAIRRLWAAFNFSASVPPNVPARILYPLLLEEMAKPRMVVQHGVIGIEFCDYEPENCPFGSTCCDCK